MCCAKLWKQLENGAFACDEDVSAAEYDISALLDEDSVNENRYGIQGECRWYLTGMAMTQVGLNRGSWGSS